MKKAFLHSNNYQKIVILSLGPQKTGLDRFHLSWDSANCSRDAKMIFLLDWAKWNLTMRCSYRFSPSWGIPKKKTSKTKQKIISDRGSSGVEQRRALSLARRCFWTSAIYREEETRRPAGREAAVEPKASLLQIEFKARATCVDNGSRREDVVAATGASVAHHNIWFVQMCVCMLQGRLTDWLTTAHRSLNARFKLTPAQ